MVWIFFLSTTGFTCNGINYRHLSSDPNRIDISSIFSKSNLLELFSQATFPRCYITQCQTLKNWVSSDGLDFFPINKPELHATESTIGVYPRTGTAQIFLPSLPNRIFWNFSHKPLFHNAISHSVRHSIIRSFPMVWICFLSTNRNYLQRNQLSAPTLGPETHTQYFYLFQIESSGTFLTSHFATMLYHIVSDTEKLVQFRWSGFFSYQQTGTTCNGINYRHLPSDWNRMDIPSIFPKSNLLELFSQATFPQCYIIQCKTLHIWVRSDGLDFLPINKPELLATESTIGTYPRTGNAQIRLLSLPNRIF